MSAEIDYWLLGGFVLLFLFGLCGLCYEAGIWRGIRQSRIDARRAYDLGVRDGRREEREEMIAP